MLSSAPKTRSVPPHGAGAAHGSANHANASHSADNRNARRRPASAVPAISSLRISPHGVEAILVNISESGVLAECGERLKPGSAVTVVFEGTFTPRNMEGRVARNSVSSMGRDGRLRYHVGIAFARPIDLGPVADPEPEPPAAAVEPAPEAPPAAAVVAAPAASGPAPAPPPASESETVEFEVFLPPGDIVRNRW